MDHQTGKIGGTDPGFADLLPLERIGCDAFERALLPLVRELAGGCRDPESRSWNLAYGAAAKRWGAQTGLPLAYGLAQIVDALTRIKGDALQVLDHASAVPYAAVTRDEQLLLLFLHQLRREHLAAGCDFMLDLTDGEMDDELMALAIEFARRHSCGNPRERRHDGIVGPKLRVIS